MISAGRAYDNSVYFAIDCTEQKTAGLVVRQTTVWVRTSRRDNRRLPWLGALRRRAPGPQAYLESLISTVSCWERHEIVGVEQIKKTNDTNLKPTNAESNAKTHPYQWTDQDGTA